MATDRLYVQHVADGGTAIRTYAVAVDATVAFRGRCRSYAMAASVCGDVLALADFLGRLNYFEGQTFAAALAAKARGGDDDGDLDGIGLPWDLLTAVAPVVESVLVLQQRHSADGAPIVLVTLPGRVVRTSQRGMF